MPFESRDIGMSTAGLRAGPRVPAWAWALLALVLGLALTFWIADAERHRSRSEARRLFVQETRDVAEAIRLELEGAAAH